MLLRFFTKESETCIAEIEECKGYSLPIPQVGTRVGLEEVCNNDSLDYDFYTVKEIETSYGGNNNHMVDVFVEGGYYDNLPYFFDEDYEDYEDDEEEKDCSECPLRDECSEYEWDNDINAKEYEKISEYEKAHSLDYYSPYKNSYYNDKVSSISNIKAQGCCGCPYREC